MHLFSPSMSPPLPRHGRPDESRAQGEASVQKGREWARSGRRADTERVRPGAKRVRGECEAVARRVLDLGDLSDPSEHAELEAEAIFSVPADLDLEVLAVDHPATRPAGHLGCTWCVICRGSTLALYQHHDR
eukprot:scaffold27087_cov74-Phaeocystis_antarctica.AAC.4